MNKREKRARLLEISERLRDLYPNAECALEYEGDPWRLLVMARLSAQCTDKRVNIVSRELFSAFPTASDMASGDIDRIKEIVKPCGLYNMKAKDIKEASRQIVCDFDGRVPDSMEELLSLSGVGRKIANLILGDVYGKEAVVCDTHCIRICGRLGMYPESEKNADKVERILRELLDLKSGSDFCHRIVIFGREVCIARSPRCEACPLAELCEHNKKSGKAKA